MHHSTLDECFTASACACVCVVCACACACVYSCMYECCICSCARVYKVFCAHLRTYTCLLVKNESANLFFPLSSGDFLPYDDIAESYWSGYFSSRSALKGEYPN